MQHLIDFFLQIVTGNTHKTGSNIVPVTSFIHNFQNLEAISNCDTASQDDNVNEFEATADHDTGAGKNFYYSFQTRK